MVWNLQHGVLCTMAPLTGRPERRSSRHPSWPMTLCVPFSLWSACKVRWHGQLRIAPEVVSCIVRSRHRAWSFRVERFFGCQVLFLKVCDERMSLKRFGLKVVLWLPRSSGPTSLAPWSPRPGPLVSWSPCFPGVPSLCYVLFLALWFTLASWSFRPLVAWPPHPCSFGPLVLKPPVL